jgi:hypothetical protein
MSTFLFFRIKSIPGKSLLCFGSKQKKLYQQKCAQKTIATYGSGWSWAATRSNWTKREGCTSNGQARTRSISYQYQVQVQPYKNKWQVVHEMDRAIKVLITSAPTRYPGSPGLDPSPFSNPPHHTQTQTQRNPSKKTKFKHF